MHVGHWAKSRLQALLTLAPKIAAFCSELQAADIEVWELRLFPVDCFSLSWLNEHAEHELGIYDEYDGPTAWRVPKVTQPSGNAGS